MPPSWLTAKTHNSMDQIIAEVSAARAERRCERLKEVDRFARVLAREMRRHDNEPRRSFRDDADPADTDTLRLHGELSANGIVLSLDETRNLSQQERGLIAEVNKKLRQGWSIAPAREDNRNDDDGAEEIAGHITDFLSGSGAQVTAEQVRTTQKAQRRKRRDDHRRFIETEPSAFGDYYKSTVEMMRSMGINVSEQELRDHDESRRQAAAYRKEMRDRYSAFPLNASKPSAAIKPSTSATSRETFDAAEIWSRRRQQAMERHA